MFKKVGTLLGVSFALGMGFSASASTLECTLRSEDTSLGMVCSNVEQTPCAGYMKDVNSGDFWSYGFHLGEDNYIIFKANRNGQSEDFQITPSVPFEFSWPGDYVIWQGQCDLNP